MKKAIVLAIALSMVLIGGGFVTAQASCLPAAASCTVCNAPVCATCLAPAPTAAGPAVAGRSCDLDWTIECAPGMHGPGVNPAGPR